MVYAPCGKKRKSRSESEVEKSQANKPLVSYKKRWFDNEGNQTGACHFWGPTMEVGNSVLEPGLEIWYRCEARQDYFVVPCRYVAVEEGQEKDENLFFNPL